MEEKGHKSKPDKEHVPRILKTHKKANNLRMTKKLR